MVKKEITEIRRNELLRIIIEQGSVRVGEAAKKLNVTPETIRKDIIYLDKHGLAKKSHGGAAAIGEMIEKSFASRKEKNIEEKNEIAFNAIQFVPDKGVIFLDSGSTVLALARLISMKSGLTVITNSIEAANVLAGSDNNVHLTGGELRGVKMSLSGIWTKNALKSVNVDVAFLGTSGFKSFDGPCVESFVEAEVKTAMMERSEKIVILADSTKFETDALVRYAEWIDIDILVTDRKITNEKLQKLVNRVDVVF